MPMLKKCPCQNYCQIANIIVNANKNVVDKIIVHAKKKMLTKILINKSMCEYFSMQMLTKMTM